MALGQPRHRRRNRRRRDGLAGTAGVLRADVTVHKETRGFDMALGHPVELFADVLADFGQIIPALAAGARCRFVVMFEGLA